MPVIYAASGNCHVYVDASADLDGAEEIVLNAKVQRPGVCNCGRDAADPRGHRGGVRAAHRESARRCRGAGASGRADSALVAPVSRNRTWSAGWRRAARDRSPPESLEAATHEDWGTEYLAMTLAVKVVDSVEQAIEHIGRYGSGHSEAIVTRDTDAARGPSSWAWTRPACM